MLAKIHLTVPPSFRKPPPREALLHRAPLDQGDYQPYQGFSVTTPWRTLLDVVQTHLSPEHLEAATSQALEWGLIRRTALKKALPTLPESARQVIERALELP